MTADTPSDRAKGARADRLAAALKANLKRRKAQARGRGAGRQDSRDQKPGDPAPAMPEPPDPERQDR